MVTVNPIRVFSASNVTNDDGEQAFDSNETDADLNGDPPYQVGDDVGTIAIIRDTGDGPGTSSGSQLLFEDGTSRAQILDEPLTLSYEDGGSIVTTTFPAGTQVQAEFFIEFDSGYELFALRFADPDGSGFITAGYALNPPDGAPAIPPPGFALGEQTGGEDFGNTPYPQLPCFVLGTLIDTPQGPRPVEALQPGDRVITYKSGTRRIHWVGQKTLPVERTRLHKPYWPVHIPAGALGNRKAIQLSPQHRVHLSGPVIEMLFGLPDVLGPAIGFCGQGGVHQVCPSGPVTYVHFACGQHELVYSDGLISETLYVPDHLSGPDHAMEQELAGLLNESSEALACPQLRIFETRLAFSQILALRQNAA